MDAFPQKIQSATNQGAGTREREMMRTRAWVGIKKSIEVLSKGSPFVDVFIRRISGSF